jgi:hypothetical protein
MSRSELEAALRRPFGFAQLEPDAQWAADKELGILDWEPDPEEWDEYLRRRQEMGDPDFPPPSFAPTLIEFNDARAKTYRKVVPTRAYKVNCSAIYYKDWAGPKGQIMGNPHMIMFSMRPDGSLDGDAYGCALTEFKDTYEPTDTPDVYRKKARIRAYRPGHPFIFRTVLADGTVEIPSGNGSATDWLVKNPGGEVYRVADETFRSSYIEAEPSKEE